LSLGANDDCGRLGEIEVVAIPQIDFEDAPSAGGG
jgi:hypothetical protein